MYQVDTKDKEEKVRIIPRAWRDQPIDRAGPHDHPSTPKSRPKRRVEHLNERTPDNPQPPGLLLPAYGTPPTANRWYFL